jgi:hypothetical protein
MPADGEDGIVHVADGDAPNEPNDTSDPDPSQQPEQGENTAQEEDTASDQPVGSQDPVAPEVPPSPDLLPNQRLASSTLDALPNFTEGFGNTNPVVSFGLSGVNDWNTNSPFIDIVKTMRPWLGHTQEKWGALKFGDLREGGYLDDQGWLKEIPEGVDRVGTLWDWKEENVEYRKGIYTMLYDGEGQINLSGNDIRIIERSDGKIVFENVSGKTMGFDILSTDPAGTGDYIRNISIVHEDHVGLHEAGAIFNPDWLDVVSDARELRFMDWMQTNGSGVTSWDDVTPVDYFSWRSPPLEVMVRLANETGIDPWFNMPHMADDAYVHNFATYVRDNLDPQLTARVEWSNEVWNSAFAQYHYAKEQGHALMNPPDDFRAALHYQGMRATEVALIWEDVFSENPAGPQLINVLGGWKANAWANNQVLTASSWKAADPENYIPPHEVFDELAVTTYFGSSIVSSSTLRQQLVDAIKDPNIDASLWLQELLMDPNYKGSIPQVAQALAEIKAITDQYNLGLVAYEGGQHVHHSFAVQGITPEDGILIDSFMQEFVRSEGMAELYAELWRVWENVSDGAFMQYGDVSTPSKYGSWSILSDLDDTNPRSEYLFSQMENATPWWDAEASSAYLQGISSNGTQNDDTIVGTAQEDYLAGSDGNDVLASGPGSDGLSGGAGNDHLIGGKGADFLRGGSGSDRFYFSAGDGDDWIADFTPEDVLDLDTYLGTASVAESAYEDVDGNLVISNGVDSITLEGLSLQDLDWVWVA